MKTIKYGALASLFVLITGLNFHSLGQTDGVQRFAMEAADFEPKLLLAEQLPRVGTLRVGTFYLLSGCQRTHTIAPPYPAYVWHQQYPVLSFGGSIYLVDDLVGTAGHDAVLADMLETLEVRIQDQMWSQFIQMSGIGGEMDEESSGFGPLANSYSSDDLWLEIISVTNAVGGQTANLVIHPPDAEASHQFDLFFNTNLSLLAPPALCVTNWTWLLRTEPGETNLVVTNLTGEQGYFMLGRTNDDDSDGLSTAFERLVSHCNPTNPFTITGLPDLWVWGNFGTFVGITASGDYDGDGNNNLAEYNAGTDPNKIGFSLLVTNQYVNTNSIQVRIVVSSGIPSSMAVLVDGANFDSATWINYRSTNTITLGAEGWHQLRVGLRGRRITSQQFWQEKRLKVDLTPPRVAVTNPVVRIVSQPMIQLRGFVSETPVSLSYDLTNADGVLTNQQVLILDRAWDTNLWDFTTNYFQAFEVPLAGGTNSIVIRATDLAGNQAATNMTYVLDYSGDTNPPAIQLSWPQNGIRISGSNFTWRGWVDDFTASVVAAQVSPAGVTNIVNGRVGRDGDFWIENVPLASGTNLLALVATDVAGNSSSTNIFVIQSGVTLTVESAALGESAWGTISDTNYAVWVNGVRAINNGDGTWSVSDPRLTLDNSVVQARAIPNSDSGGNGSGGGGGSNPDSAGASDAESELEWPVSYFYHKARHKVEDFSSIVMWVYPFDTTNYSTLSYHYEDNWEERGGREWQRTANSRAAKFCLPSVRLSLHVVRFQMA